jgi:ribosomal protein S18 acetylase RimI-like enzyme
MIPLAPPLRRAVAADGPVLAKLIVEAGEGLPLVVWREMAEPGEDIWAVGARRQAAKAEEGRIVVVDEGAGAVAGLTGYAIGAEPAPLDVVPPLFQPLQELENLALESWYVNVLAALPEERGRGWGTLLLGVAEDIARAEGLSRISLIVSAENVGARRLYERRGFSETARRAMVTEGWREAASDWILMIKPLP